jgi:hypothetical protein
MLRFLVGLRLALEPYVRFLIGFEDGLDIGKTSVLNHIHMTFVTHISNTDIHLTNTYLEKLRKNSKEGIKDRITGYYTKYFAVHHLQTLAQSHPCTLDQEAIEILASLLKGNEFSDQRQCLFLFRQVAGTLTAIVQHANGHPIAWQAFSALEDILGSTSGHAHRATAEALSSLPFTMNQPVLECIDQPSPPLLSWRRLIAQLGLEISKEPKFFGRSLVAELTGKHQLLVIKLARICDNLETLCGENLWLEHLRSENYTFSLPFLIPDPIRVGNSFLFRLRSFPVSASKPEDIHPKGYAIAFLADHEYFSYPNQTGKTDHLSNEGFKEVMGRNAWLLGRLSGLGIIHSAPIPLFHNRVQAGRRRDLGLYEWFRAGRLDRWLESCAYPNIGTTGLRDFEHLDGFKGSNMQLYRSMGNHFLSLFLVTGSFFRNKQRDRVGLDDNGNPVDVRYLFDKKVFKEILEEIFIRYYNGFVGSDFEGEILADLNHISSRMIEEMGVDRYMKEIFRAADQDALDEEAYRCFLKKRGLSDEDIMGLRKGESDITLLTGPHLGGFNRPISLPEMIECISTMSALCMVGKFWEEAKTVN